MNRPRRPVPERLPLEVMKKGGRCVLAAKRKPHRPRYAPALGLRAGGRCHYNRRPVLVGDATMVPSSLFGLRKFRSRPGRAGRSRPPEGRFRPQLEALESRLAPANVLTVNTANDEYDG